MINYSLDRSIRKTLLIIIAAISFLLHNPTNWLLELIYNFIIAIAPFTQKTFRELSIIGIEVSQISILGIFGFLYWLYTHCIWKIKFIRTLTNVPDLSGTWEGKLQSSYVDPQTGETIPPLDVTAEITQNWNRIQIICHFPSSSSFSQTASIRVENEKGVVLGFSFRNESKDVKLAVREYTGYNELVYKDDTLEGIYFTNRGDGSHGNLKLHRITVKKTEKQLTPSEE